MMPYYFIVHAFDIGTLFAYICVVKHITFILSLYILGLTFSPAIGMAMQSDGCMKSCSKETSKDSDGCQKGICTPYSCCLKNLMPMTAPYQYSAPFVIAKEVRNNFSTTRDLVSLRSFDIWHPPRLI